MGTIRDYSDLIRQIPVFSQSTIVKKEVWERFSYDDDIKEAIFGSNDKVEISRADVLFENNPAKKIVMTLMWGYPTGGRGNNIVYILDQIDDLVSLLLSVSEQNLTSVQASAFFSRFADVRGLGISTWTKLIYFFNVAVDSRKCQIYDLKIVDSLNRKQFIELGAQEWRQDIAHYFRYLELVDNLATNMGVLPEQVELFLFYFNLYYKFITKSE